jgi:translation initiation factor 4E
LSLGTTKFVNLEWVFWEHRASGAGSKNPNQWKENMSELCHFSTVEDFWRNFNHIPKPSEVFFDGDCRKKVGPEGKTIEEYSLFKKGIEPEWGDPLNVKGGEWFCRQFFEGELLDLYWSNLAMGIVGETIEDGIDTGNGIQDIINGARVVDKSRGFPMYRLELWVSSREPGIKDKLRKRLEQIMMDGQPASQKAHPKFEWKDHSS